MEGAVLTGSGGGVVYEGRGLTGMGGTPLEYGSKWAGSKRGGGERAELKEGRASGGGII